MADMILFSRAAVLALLFAAAALPARAETGAAAPSDPTKNGEILFATSCGWCHSDGGREAGKGPKLAGTARDDAFIINRIKNGKAGAMPAWGKVFDDAQIQNILHYIRSLPSK